MREATPSPLSARFRPTQRVKARSDFLRVQSGASGARRVHTPHFVLLVSLRAASLSEPLVARVGVTVTKKIGCAVERNRVKRLVREVFRTHVDYFPPSHDVIFIARHGAPGLNYESVRAEVEAVRGAMRAAAERNLKAARLAASASGRPDGKPPC